MCYDIHIHITHTERQTIFTTDFSFGVLTHRLLSNANSINSHSYISSRTNFFPVVYLLEPLSQYRRVYYVCAEKSNMQIDALSSGNFNKKKKE